MSPDVTVIIPCYNASKWILDAIDSALDQEDVRVEVIVVDDGSTDKSAELVESGRPRVRIIRKENGGVSSARNCGVRHASGRYIKFLDADDVMPRNSLKAAFACAQILPSFTVVGRADEINMHGHICETNAYNIAVRPSHGEEIDPLFLLTQATHSSIFLIPRDYFSFGVEFPEEIKLGEEYAFSRKLVSLGGGFVYLDIPVSLIRDHDGERLSRQGKEVDYQKQLVEIKNSFEYVQKIRAGDHHPAILILAKRVWVLGRDCVRFGYLSAANEHFEFAWKIFGRHAIVGKMPYRILVQIVGPIVSENLIERMKGRIW